jgi:MFS family permease
MAVIPAFLALTVLVLAVREPDRAEVPRVARIPLHRRELARLGLQCWLVIALATVFTLARFSEAFLILRAQQVGLSIALVPLVLVVMNVVYSVAAYPAGVASDRHGRQRVLALGIVMLVAADIVLAAVPGIGGVAAGVALWGLHMAFTQGLFAAWIADTAPAELRGTAFGMFNLVTGGALLAASLAAGLLWDQLGAPAMFLAGAVMAAVALGGLLVLGPRLAGYGSRSRSL